MDLFKIENLTKQELEEISKKIKELDALKPCNQEEYESPKNDFESLVAELSPIEVATKLVNAKIWVPEHTTFGIKYEGCYSEVFDIEQLREIAAYLTLYCMYNKEEK